jgi:hypothetical protein
MFGNRAVRQRLDETNIRECPDECLLMTCNRSTCGDFSSLTKEGQLHLLPLSLPSAHEFPMGTEQGHDHDVRLPGVRRPARVRTRDAALLFSIAPVFGLGLFGAAGLSDDSCWTTHLVCSLPLR